MRYLCLVLLFCALTVHAGQRTLVLKNWLERDWPRTLLQYDLTFQPGEFQPGKVAVMNSAGDAVPSQVDITATHPDGSIAAARVSFYAALGKGEAFQYQVISCDTPPVFPARVVAKEKRGMLEVTSAEAGVRLPAPGEKVYKTPIDPAEAPAPILGYRLCTGQWAGKGWLESDRKVVSLRQHVVADGPLYKEYAYQVNFAPEGYYKARVRVEAEGTLVTVAEEL